VRSTKEHFIALETYAKENDVKIKYREFLIARHLAKSIVRFDFLLFVKQIKNIVFFISLIFSRKKNIVLGMVPLDFHLPLLKLFFKGHYIFFITSWGDWSGKQFPKNKYSKTLSLKKSWRSFLEYDIKGIFCITKSALDNLRENYNITAPAVVVGHAIDNSIQLEKNLDINKITNNIQLIYVGRLVETKGINELIELMQKLDAKKYTLKIIGDVPLKKEVEVASDTFSNIQYLGYVKDKKELFNLYSQSDVQLLFSKKSKINKWEELFGMVIIEAMYCGLVTIATKHVGPKSIIENGVDGFLVNENNMIEETIKILEETSLNDHKMKLNAKNKAKEFYKKNLSKKWAKILDAYE
jgi:glycosyltransferase involved in cell wall biosynthesis